MEKSSVNQFHTLSRTVWLLASLRPYGVVYHAQIQAFARYRTANGGVAEVAAPPCVFDDFGVPQGLGGRGKGVAVADLEVKAYFPVKRAVKQPLQRFIRPHAQAFGKAGVDDSGVGVFAA